MNIDIALAPDNNYAKHAACVVASVLAHNERHNVNVWIIDGGLSNENKAKLACYDGLSNVNISFCKINPDYFKDFPESGYITRAMWYRLKIGSVLPTSVNLCLYLDCDTIVNADLEELFSIDLHSKCAAVGVDCIFEKFVKHNRKYFPQHYQYFNSGVILFNLAEWRRQNVEEEILAFVRENPETLKLLDQTILNIFLQNRSVDFGIKYNFQFTPKVLCETSYSARKEEYRNAAKNPAIIHFVGDFKPWKVGFNALNPYYKLYIQALSKTQWKMTESEKEEFITLSEKKKMKVFLMSLLKQIKRKPWWILRKYFWHRIFL